MTSSRPGSRLTRRLLALLLAVVLIGVAACSDDDSSSSDDSTDDSAGGGESASGDCSVQLGYSAWPGWFPLAITEEQGFFEDAGVEVELIFFADYLGSLDAMVAGELDGNTQTLNDTMLGVASGSEQVIVVNNDFSTGNDAIIVDESIETVADLEGKTIAAEPGVVDHFLLLQGLEEEGLTEDDVDFVGVPTDAAAAGFADGEFDGVGVFAPFTTQALEREGSHVLFSSADFEGTISDHIVVTPDLVEECPEAVQGLTDAWYATLDYMEANPEEALATLAEVSESTEGEYEEFDAGTTILSAAEALAAFEPGDDTSSLQYTAELINPFLVEAGLIPEEAPLDGLFDPSFTQAYVDGQ
jgi:NitT/TauT family transport system substrate-binding protein